MNYNVTGAEKSTVRITMNFDNAEWTAAIDKAYARTRHKYTVNGFRKGKAPKHILELYYGKGIFYEDALNILLEENYEKVLEEEKEHIEVVGQPSFELGEETKIEEGKIVVVAIVPVKPEVTLGAYTGIKITKYEYTVTDADVEREVESAREHAATSVDVTDRAAVLTDTVKIDFVGKVDGVAFEGGTAEGYDLTLGSGQFIPGFEEGVVGMQIGETRDVHVTFPDDYQSEELKGKAAVFTVTLHAIKGKVLPELNDEFAKKMGAESVEAYRERLRKRLEESAANRSRNETENAILSEIAKNATAEIPDAMVDSEEEACLQRVEYSLMYRGIKLDDYLAYLGSTREEYKKNFAEEAKRNIMHQLIVETLIKKEGISATEEELDEKIAAQAQSVGKDPEEYKKTMDPRQRSYLENDIKVTKLFEFLMANNEMVTEAKA